MKLSNVILVTLSLVGASAFAAGGVTIAKPRLTAPAAKGVTPAAPKTGLGTLLNDKTVKAANDEKVAGAIRCDVASIANELSKASNGMVSASSFQASLNGKTLSTGNCSPDGLMGVKDAKVIAIVGKTSACMLQAGGQALAADQAEAKRGECLQAANQNVAKILGEAAPTQTLAEFTTNATYIHNNCAWF